MAAISHCWCVLYLWISKNYVFSFLYPSLPTIKPCLLCLIMQCFFVFKAKHNTFICLYLIWICVLYQKPLESLKFDFFPHSHSFRLHIIWRSYVLFCCHFVIVLKSITVNSKRSSLFLRVRGHIRHFVVFTTLFFFLLFFWENV